MKPGTLDLEVYRGDSFELFGRIRTTTAGSYLDLTGWVGIAQIRSDPDSDSVIESFSVTLGNQSTAPGSVFVRLTAAQTSDLAFTSAQWDLQFTLPDGTVRTYLKGKVTLNKDISRAA